MTLGDAPLLRFAAGRKFPPCQDAGWFRVWVSDAGGKRKAVFNREVISPNESRDTGWIENEVDLADYAGQQVNITFQTETSRPGRCDWFLWAEPEIVSRPATK